MADGDEMPALSADHAAAVELIAQALAGGELADFMAITEPLSSHLVRQVRARLAFAALYGLHPDDWGSILSSVATMRAAYRDRFPAPRTDAEKVPEGAAVN